MNFTKEYDVVVAGGGIAGVAAAIAAARQGAKTVLVEKSVWWGGLATGGMIFVYLPLCDGHGTQVSHGLAEKLFHASFRYGPGGVDPRWAEREPCTAGNHVRYRTRFSPAAFVLAMDEMLEEYGVTLWLDTRITGVRMRQNKLCAVEAVNQSGTGLLHGNCFVDATGDALLTRLCGGAFAEGANSLAFWGLQCMEDGVVPMQLSPHCGGMVNGAIEPDCPCDAPVNARRGLDGAAVSRFVLDSRRWAREHFRREQAAPGGAAKTYPVTLPIMPLFRKIARIKSRGELPDNSHNRPFADSVGMVADWNYSGIVQEIPFSAMLPAHISGVVAAGRAIDAAGYSWELVRSIPAVAVSGEAAGTAAAMAVARNCPPEMLAISELQNTLRANGGKLTLPEVGLSYTPAAQQTPVPRGAGH